MGRKRKHPEGSEKVTFSVSRPMKEMLKVVGLEDHGDAANLVAHLVARHEPEIRKRYDEIMTGRLAEQADRATRVKDVFAALCEIDQPMAVALYNAARCMPPGRPRINAMDALPYRKNDVTYTRMRHLVLSLLALEDMLSAAIDAKGTHPVPNLDIE